MHTHTHICTCTHLALLAASKKGDKGAGITHTTHSELPKLCKPQVEGQKIPA